jgi:sugar phosphate isomerase/epimerase
VFKQGAFVNVLTANVQHWRDAFKKIEHFPSLDHVELWLEHIPKDNELREFREIFRGTHLIIHGPFIHTSLVSHLPEVVTLTERRFEEAIEFADKVDAPLVTFHAGSYPLFEPRGDVLDKLATRFERFSALKRPLAALENMPLKSHGTVREPIGHLTDYDDLLNLLPKVRFTLDIGHCLQNEDDFIPFIKKHSSRIENIHLHDGIPRGRGHLRLGAGILNLNPLLDVLASVNYQRHVSLETISLDDTTSSWRTLLQSEAAKGLTDSEPMPSHHHNKLATRSPQS